MCFSGLYIDRFKGREKDVVSGLDRLQLLLLQDIS